MVALRLAYSAPPAPTFLPVGRWLRRAWSAYWEAVKDHMACRHGIPRPPFHGL
jgi:hypothetical protein